MGYVPTFIHPNIQQPTPANPAAPNRGQPAAAPAKLHALIGPTPQDYADALDRLQRNAPNTIRTPGALATNLLADALDRYGQARAQAKAQQAQASNTSSQPSQDSAAPPGAMAGSVQGTAGGGIGSSPANFQGPITPLAQYGRIPAGLLNPNPSNTSS
jgi:hypothetical protein